MKRPGQSRSARPARAPIRIWLVDDEPLLLDLAEIALKPDHYALRKFTDPELAYKAFVRARARPHLVVTDYAMGRLNGCDFLARCQHLHPQIKTILLSGTVGPEIVLNASARIDRFLGKPYQPETLAQLVRSVLAGIP
ncbi:MAG: response regulator [Verrucomicrobia bacterium]|nr:response regulator [Verrucomicrobiota bacterium]